MRQQMRLAWRLCAGLTAALIAISASATDVRITSPQNGDVIRDLSGSLFVEVSLGERDLKPDMRFRLLMDGRPVTPVAYVPVFRLHDVPPGQHELRAQIVDQQGDVMLTSEPVRFRMLREAGDDADPDAPMPSGSD